MLFQATTFSCFLVPEVCARPQYKYEINHTAFGLLFFQTQEDISQVIVLLEELGTLEYCNEMAHKYLNLAVVELDEIAKPSKALDKLHSLFKYLVLRDY